MSKITKRDLDLYRSIPGFLEENKGFIKRLDAGNRTDRIFWAIGVAVVINVLAFGLTAMVML